MLDAPTIIALAIAGIAGVLVYVLVQRVSNRSRGTRHDTRATKSTPPRRLPQRRR